MKAFQIVKLILAMALICGEFSWDRVAVAGTCSCTGHINGWFASTIDRSRTCGFSSNCFGSRTLTFEASDAVGCGDRSVPNEWSRGCYVWYDFPICARVSDNGYWGPPVYTCSYTEGITSEASDGASAYTLDGYLTQ